MKKKKVDEELIRKIAKLAMIEVTDVEIKKYSGQIDSLLDYVQKISEIDTEDVEEFKSNTNRVNVFRKDEVDETISQKDAIGQSRKKNGCIVVPSVI